LGIRGSTTTDPRAAGELGEVLSEAEALAGPDASGVLAKGESEPALSSVARDAFEDELEHSRRELNIARSHVVSGVLLVANTLAVVWRVIDSFTIAENPARSTALAMVHAASLPVAALGYFATSERGAKTWWVSQLRDRSGEFAVAHLSAIGAALSILALPAQREPFALVAAMVAAAMMFRARRSVLLASVASAAAMTTLVALLSVGRVPSLPVLCVSGFFAFACMKVSATMWQSYVTEVRVRVDNERLARELDQLVQEQTASVIA